MQRRRVLLKRPDGLVVIVGVIRGGGGGGMWKRGENAKWHLVGGEKGQKGFPLLPKLHRKIRLSVTAKTRKNATGHRKNMPPPSRTYMNTSNDRKHNKPMPRNVKHERVKFHEGYILLWLMVKPRRVLLTWTMGSFLAWDTGKKEG